MSKVYNSWEFDDLSNYFQAQGIADERAVMAIVLTSYWRHLHNLSIDFEGQIKSERDVVARENCQTLITRLLDRGVGVAEDIVEGADAKEKK